MNKQTKNNANRKEKQEVSFSFFKHLLKKRNSNYTIPESKLSKKLNITKKLK